MKTARRKDPHDGAHDGNRERSVRREHLMRRSQVRGSTRHTIASLLITGPESFFLNSISCQFHDMICLFSSEKDHYSISEREKRKKENQKRTRHRTSSHHITHHTHTHLPVLPLSVLFLMIPDELLIAFGDEPFMFLTCKLSEAHVTSEMLHSAFFSLCCWFVFPWVGA